MEVSIAYATNYSNINKEGRMSSERKGTFVSIEERVKKQSQVKCINEGLTLTETVNGLLKLWLAGKIQLPKEERVAA
jgi:hypothetical protein